jgi:hypothetical protein
MYGFDAFRVTEGEDWRFQISDFRLPIWMSDMLYLACRDVRLGGSMSDML